MLLWVSLMNLAGGDGAAPPAADPDLSSRYRASFRATDVYRLILFVFGGS
jgi:hypothetical protein